MPQITRFTSTKTIAKTYTLTPMGALDKIQGGEFGAGKFETLAINGVLELRDLIQTLTPKNALAIGVNCHVGRGLITTESKQNADFSKGYARTQKNWVFSGGEGFLFLDVDYHELNGFNSELDAYSYLIKHAPALSSAPALIVPSSSSYIYSGDDIKNGFRGCHIYIHIKDATDIHRATHALADRLSLCDTPNALRAFIAKNGRISRRGVLDVAVSRPERLIFASCAALGPHLAQRRTMHVVNPHAAPLDTRRALPDLSTGDKNALENKWLAVKNAPATLNDQARIIALTAPTSATPAQVAAYVATVRRDLSTGAFPRQTPLFFDDGAWCMAGDVADDVALYVGRRLCEPGEIGGDPRIAFVTKSGAIYTHAHGGMLLKIKEKTDVWKLSTAFEVETKKGKTRPATYAEIEKIARDAVDDARAFGAMRVMIRTLLKRPFFTKSAAVERAVDGVLSAIRRRPDAYDVCRDLSEWACGYVKKAQAQAVRRVALSDARAARHYIYPYTNGAHSHYVKPGVTIIKGAHGTGKTQTFAPLLIARDNSEEYINGRGTCFFITNRQSLVEDISTKFRIPHYSDHATISGGVDKLALCVASLCRDDITAISARVSALFIDEFSDVIRFLTTPQCTTKGATPVAVFNKMRDLISAADYVYIADADLDDYALDFLESCREPGERFRIITMPPRRETNKKAAFNCGAGAFAKGAGDALAALHARENVVIACDSKDNAAALFEYITAQGISALCIHKDNKDRPEQARFLANPGAESLKYRALIYSPVISTGVSIVHDAPHFTRTYLIATGRSITPATAIQMMRRVRYVSDFSVFCEHVTHDDDAQTDANARAIGQIRSLELANKNAELDAYTLHANSIRASDDDARSNFSRELFYLLTHYDFRVNLECDDAKSDDAKAARDAYLDALDDATLAAPPIDAHTATTWGARRGALSDDQHAALRRYECLTGLGFAPDAPLDAQTLGFWDNGRATRRLERFACAFGIALKTDASHVVFSHHIEARRALYAAIFEPIAGTGARMRGGRELVFRITPAQAHDVITRLIARRFECVTTGIAPAYYARLKRNARLDDFDRRACDMREIAALFEKLGLKIERVGKNDAGDYGLDAGVYDVVLAHAARRYECPIAGHRGQNTCLSIDKSAHLSPRDKNGTSETGQKTGTPTPPNAKAQAIAQAQEMARAGLTVREIAQAIGVGKSTVSRWLNA